MAAWGVLWRPLVLSVVVAALLSGVGKWLWDAYHHRRRAFAEELVKTGGMPSGHGAVVSSVSTSVFLLEGFSTLFFVALVFSLLVIRDSFGVRWSVGQQAELLNRLASHDHVRRKVKVIEGHTLVQVVTGVALGILVTLLVFAAW